MLSTKSSLYAKLALMGAIVAETFTGGPTSRLSFPPIPAERAAHHDPQSGRSAYRGRPGTKAFQRAAKKARNVRRHRAALRG